MKKIDDSFKVSKAYGRLSVHTLNDGEQYYEGEVITSLGIVTAIAWKQAKKGEEICRLDFVCNGRHYMRTIYRSKPYTKQGIAMVAHRYAREIKESNDGHSD